jgi:hypothetical protein
MLISPRNRADAAKGPVGVNIGHEKVVSRTEYQNWTPRTPRRSAGEFVIKPEESYYLRDLRYQVPYTR